MVIQKKKKKFSQFAESLKLGYGQDKKKLKIALNLSQKN